MRSEYWLIGLLVAAVVLFGMGYGYHLMLENERGEAVARLNEQRETLRQRRIEATRQAGAAGNVVPSVSHKVETLNGFQQDGRKALQEIKEKEKVLASSARWAKAHRFSSNYWENMSAEQQAIVGEFLAANRDYIQDLRRLADTGGPFSELDVSNLHEVDLSNHFWLGKQADLLLSDTACLVSNGDYAEAIANLTAIARLAVAVLDEPLLMSQMYGQWIGGKLFGGVEQYIRGTELPTALAEQLITEVGRIGDRINYAEAFMVEASMYLDIFEGIQAGKLEQTVLSDVEESAFFFRLYGSSPMRLFLNLDEVTLAGLVARMGDALQLPFHEAKPLLDRIDAEIERLPRTRVVSRMMLPALTRAAEYQARHEAGRGLVQVGLAVEHYQATNGAYPDTLDPVAPILGGTLPEDPYTGLPFVYQSDGSTYLLYSARGTHLQTKGGYGMYDDQGNIVWRRVR